MDPIDLDTMSSSSSSSSSYSPSELCSVCSNSVHGKHYGVKACLGCTVFFRRAVYNKTQYICCKGGQCSISFIKRKACRYCRLQKCFKVGMKAEAVQYRDAIGPRIKILTARASIIPDTPLDKPLVKQPIISRDPIINALLSLQSKHRVELDRLFTHRANNNTAPTLHDIGLTLKTGIKHAKEWILELKIPSESMKNGSSEFVVGLILIDEKRKISGIQDIPGFVNDSTRFINDPLIGLKIDEIESVILKTLVLLNVCLSTYQTDHLRNHCLIQLLIHCNRKFPCNGPIRFGELLLVMGSLRSEINIFFNQTAGSPIFHVVMSDPFLRQVFLE